MKIPRVRTGGLALLVILCGQAATGLAQSPTGDRSARGATVRRPAASGEISYRDRYNDSGRAIPVTRTTAGESLHSQPVRMPIPQAPAPAPRQEIRSYYPGMKPGTYTNRIAPGAAHCTPARAGMLARGR